MSECEQDTDGKCDAGSDVMDVSMILKVNAMLTVMRVSVRMLIVSFSLH